MAYKKKRSISWNEKKTELMKIIENVKFLTHVNDFMLKQSIIDSRWFDRVLSFDLAKLIMKT